MADLEKTVSIIFAGEDRNLSTTTRTLDESLTSLGGCVQSVAEPLADLGKGVLAADAAFLTFAAGGIVLATKEAGEFDTSFREITTLLDANPVQLEEFSREILDYSRSSVKSIEDINASVYAAISAGVDYEDSLEFLSASEKLAVAGRAELADVTVLMASSLNAYGVSVDEATRYSDVFFQTVKLGQTTIPELANGIARLTGLAAPAGVEIETLGAAIAALTATGLPTEQAISSLKAAIANIIKPTSDAAKAAEALGIDFSASALSTKGLEEVLWEAYEATGGNVDQMARLFGNVEGLNAAMILAADESGKFRDALKAMESSAGSTAEAYEKMVGSYDAANRKFANNVQATLIIYGQEILPYYDDLLEALGGVAAALAEVVDTDSFKPVQDALGDFAGWLTETLNAIAEAIPEAFEQVDFSGLVDAIEELGISLDGMFDGVDLTTSEGLSIVMQAVVDTTESLIRVTDGMLDVMGPMIKGLAEWVQGFNALDDESKEGAGSIMAAAIAIVDASKLIVAAIIGIGASADEIKRVWDVLAGVTQVTFNSITLTLSYIAKDIVDAALLVVEAFDFITFGQVDWLEQSKATLEGYRAALEKQIATDGTDIIRGFNKIWGETEDATKKTAGSVETVSDAVKELPAEKSIDVHLLDAFKPLSEMELIEQGLYKIPPEKHVDVTASADKEEVLRVGGMIIETLPDGHIVLTSAEVDTSSVLKAGKDLQQDLDSLDKLIEWRAKLDIAEVEANADKVMAISRSIEAVWASTADIISSAFGVYVGANDSEQRFIEQTIKEQQRLQKDALKIQEDLADAEIAYMEAKRRALNEGDAIISVSGEGLQPHLEAFMWEILSAIQVRVNDEGLAMLTGL